MSEGIMPRHAKSCASRRDGGRCDCTPTWQANVRDARLPKALWRSTKTKSEARRWRADTLAALDRGDVVSVDRGAPLTEAVEAWLAAMRAGQVRNRSGDDYKPSAICGYEQALRLRVLPVLGYLRLNEVQPRDVQLMVDGLVRDGWSAATIDSALTPLRAMYRRAVARGDARGNPTLRIEKPAVRPKLKQVASAREAARMVAVLDDQAERALWALALYLGLRRGELIALRWEDVDLARGVLRVEHGWDDLEGEIAPKSRQGRRAVPLFGEVRDHLVALRAGCTGEGRVFASPGWVKDAADRARPVWRTYSLPLLTLHVARHTAASLMIDARLNIKAVSTFMGHANIGITLDLYGHLLPESVEEAATLMDAYLAQRAGEDVARSVAREPLSPMGPT